MKSAETIAILEKYLGIPGEYGALWTGRRLLKETWKHKPAVIRNSTVDLRDLPFNDSARDILFRTPLHDFMTGWTCHHYDKNSAYLSACRGVQTGIGDPIYMMDGDDNQEIVPGLPGIYGVSFLRPEFAGKLLPLIIEDDQQWVTNDVLMFARSRGYAIRIHEAYVFTDYTKVLDKWALKIWDTRQALKGVHQGAYAEMKLMALMAVGGFAINKEKQPTLEMVHPNWWSDVVGKARVNMHCNLEKFAAVGCVPVLIYSDGLWFITRDSNPRTAVPGILDRMGELGGYKHVYSFPVTPDVIDQASEMKPGELVSLFHLYGKHEGE